MAGPTRLRNLPYHTALTQAARVLAAAGIEAPRREARLLLAHLLGVTHRAVPADGAAVDVASFEAALARRAAHEPFGYITGTAGFWTFELEVSRATLIPRADSETLIEVALAQFPDRLAVSRVLDLGTGTGCLLLAALTEFPAAFGTGVDVVPEAAALAARNATRLGLGARSAFLAADWAAPLAGRMDLILCNPPYIEGAAIAGLMPEVACHEPASALDGGADGLTCYRAVIPCLPALLSPHGCAVLEIGQGQAQPVATIARATGFTRIDVHADLAGVERALLLRWPG